MDSCGEYFFFYGLTDFILFLVLAWRHSSLVSEIFFCLPLPGVLGFSSVCHEPCPTTNFLIIYFCLREEGATSVLGSQPIVWLQPSSFPCQATRVRSPSTNIYWSPLRPTFFLNFIYSLFILRPTTGQARHKAPLQKWVRTQGRSPHASGKIQKHPRSRRHPPKGAPQRPGNKQQTSSIFFFLTVILWRLATINSNTRIVVILFLSSQWDTTWHYSMSML